MKYRFKGEYREFRGRIFAHGKAVEIDDAPTLAALASNPEFEPVKVVEEKRRPVLSVKRK